MGIHTLTVKSPKMGWCSVVICSFQIFLTSQSHPNKPLDRTWNIFQRSTSTASFLRVCVKKCVLLGWTTQLDYDYTMLSPACHRRLIQDQHLDLQEFSRFIKTFLKADQGWISVETMVWAPWGPWDAGDSTNFPPQKNNQKGPVECGSGHFYHSTFQGQIWSSSFNVSRQLVKFCWALVLPILSHTIPYSNNMVCFPSFLGWWLNFTLMLESQCHQQLPFGT